MNGLPAYNLENLEILYIERFDHVRAMMRMVLHEFGIRRISDTAILEDAHDIIMHSPPDILITDWSPEFNSLALINWIRRGKNSPNMFMPVVVTSAYTEKQHIWAARDQGITEFLAKPVSPKMLYGRICALITKARPFVECKVYFGPDRRRHTINFTGEERRVSEAVEA
ncbi:MAG: response regulator [Rhodospirillales bacterium]|nr:response regulator [Rhodospirillales bacterium]